MTKRSELITVICFCLIVAVLAVGFWIMPDKDFSEQEKRNLEQMPEIDSESFFSGKFSKDINAYYADQFLFRQRIRFGDRNGSG